MRSLWCTRFFDAASSWLYWLVCIAALVFLVAPLLVVVPLSFSAEPYYRFTPAMLELSPAGYSTRWYSELFHSNQWMAALGNSVIIGLCATAVATSLAVPAAFGLVSLPKKIRQYMLSFMLSPLIVPLLVAAAALFFFYSRVHLVHTYLGVILAHAALGAPFVVLTVVASLSRFDAKLEWAAYSLGASHWRTFWTVKLPLVVPGIAIGAVFAFMTSFDEVVIVLFLAGPEQRTLPVLMWSGLREQMSPVVLAVSCLLTAVSVVVIIAVAWLKRKQTPAWLHEQAYPCSG